jgi:mannose-6-phosphate isomerase-like protein (cupin superfamily)
MKLSFNTNVDKAKVFQTIEKKLCDNEFNIISMDVDRPWGGFFVIDEKQSEAFIKEYFPEINQKDLGFGKKLSPKFLIVEPGKKLSWQYHFRRAEIWKVVSGIVGIATSDTDKETEIKEYGADSLIQLKQGERHRLVGLGCWGIVAEIWQHTDIAYPSDEEDIVRLQDDYGR